MIECKLYGDISVMMCVSEKKQNKVRAIIVERERNDDTRTVWCVPSP